MSRSKVAAMFACATLALGAAACGGENEGSKGGAGSSDVASDPAGAFASSCGNCHTLSAAATTGQVGPNLDELKPDQATVAAAIKEGPGVMPSGLFQGADVDAVAKYVADNAGK